MFEHKTYWAMCVGAVFALGLAACGGNGGDRMLKTGDMPTEVNPPTVNPPNEMPGLGQWESILLDGMEVGFMNTVQGLEARYDTSGANPSITVSSPMQPAVEGTWMGMWGGYLGEELDTRDGGTARVDVTIQGSDVHATLTYNGIDGIGSVTTDRVRVAGDGRFAPGATVTVEGTPLTYTGEGQFGGTDQRGVVDYMGGVGFRSVFYGDRN